MEDELLGDVAMADAPQLAQEDVIESLLSNANRTMVVPNSLVNEEMSCLAISDEAALVLRELPELAFMTSTTIACLTTS